MRSNYIKQQIKTVISKNHQIISTNYNNTPRNTLNYNKKKYPRYNGLTTNNTKLNKYLYSHTKKNTLIQSTYHNTNITENTIYVTLSPYLMYTKMLINTNIQKIIYNTNYPLKKTTKSLLKKYNVTLHQHHYNPHSS